MNKRIIDQRELIGIVSNICRNILLSDWRPDYIVGITRGGLIPAVLISQYMKIPMHTLGISLRDQCNSESNLWMSQDAFGTFETEHVPYFEVNYLPAVVETQLKKNILVVDDINDTGATLNWLINDWQMSCHPDNVMWNKVWNNNVRFAVIVDNLSSRFSKRIDYAGLEVNKAENNVWIDFPWEDWWQKS